MSSADQPALGSPQTNSSAGGSDAELAESGSADLPGVEERVAEFVDEYPQLAGLPISESDGQKLREELTEATFEEEWRYDHDRGEPVCDRRFHERRAVTWAATVRAFLEWNEEYRGRRLRMARGKGQGWSDFESFTTEAEHSFHPAYAEREYAQLQALAREVAGGDRPSGGEAVGEFEEPYLIFLSLTASSTPDGSFVPPVDHDRAVVDTWSGNDGVYRELWNVFSDLGVPAEKWVYHRQGEPHPGGGPATCYRHDHPMILVDAAAVDGDLEAEQFEGVIDRHVEKCEWAGEAGHDYDDAISVEPVGEEGVADVAGYMAKYVSYESEDLAERDIEYVAWGAIQWATNSQKYTRSKGANDAIRADACRQRAEDPDCEQIRPHGAEVRRATSDGAREARHRIECELCGSPWGIDQEQSLAAHRLADGGSEGGSSSGAASTLSDRWPSAEEAAVTGEDGGVTAFKKPPRWRLDAIVDADGDEHQPGSGGPSMKRLVLENRTLGEWSQSRKPPPGETTEVGQKARREQLLEAAAVGATRDQLLAVVDADDATVEADIDRLLRDGRLYYAGDEELRTT